MTSTRTRNKAADKGKKAADASTKGTESTITVEVVRNKEDGTKVKEPLEVHNFVTEAARVEVHHGVTQQIADYDYLRVDVTVSLPCYREEVEEVVSEASNLCYTRVAEEVAAAMGEQVPNENAAAQQGAEATASEEEPLTYEELTEFSNDELIALAEENDIKLTAAVKKNDEKLFTALCDGLNLHAEPEEGEEEEELTFESLEAMEDADLILLAKEEKVKLTAAEKKDGDKVFHKLVAHFEFVDPSAGAEEGEEGEGITYAEVAAMEDKELIALAKEQEIKLTAAEKKDGDKMFDKICDALGLEEGEEGGTDPEEEEGGELTADLINEMGLDELLELVDELAEDPEDPIEITVSARQAKQVALLRKHVISSLDL